MYKGQFFILNTLGDNQAVELVFNAEKDPVNTLRNAALIELEACITLLEEEEPHGLIIRSGKALFSAGADVKAFRSLFKDGEATITPFLYWVHSIYNRVEDLDCPKVAIVNGVAAGGGVELSLLADYRLATTDAKISLPEVKLGIMPGWGGVTRLPRIVGVDTALGWLTTGKNFSAEKALSDHVVDGIIDPSQENPVEQALRVIERAQRGELDWQARQAEKRQALPVNDLELAMSINVARGMVAKAAGPHYPAPGIILDTVFNAARCARDEALKKPENFCGSHFFNPVHRMPLVEVIRGEKTSTDTIAKAVNYVLQLGKVPVVVNDCAGFLVNRCLTPYFLAFNQLLVDGGSIAQADKVMSKGFGWPMGPAHLADVIGLDTAKHCMDVMDEAFPARLGKPQINLIEMLCRRGQLGQKSEHGFYSYSKDRKGRLKPSLSVDTQVLLDSECAAPAVFSDEEVTMRMMLPMIFEAIRCLDEGIISSPQEGDIAFVYGTGFPPFRGGIFYYMDSLGLDNLVELAQKYEALGSLYAIPQGLIERANNNQSFYA